MTFKRNYRKEYDNYHSRPEQIKRRDSRNAARNSMKKRGVNVTGKEFDNLKLDNLSSKYKNLFELIEEKDFREDVSSTEKRRQNN